MPNSRPPYPAEFRARMVDLIRAGRTPEALSRAFEFVSEHRAVHAVATMCRVLGGLPQRVLRVSKSFSVETIDGGCSSWPLSWMPGAGESSAGPWPPTCARNSCSTR